MPEKHENKDFDAVVIRIPFPKSRKKVLIGMTSLVTFVILCAATVLSQGIDCTDAANSVICIFQPDTPIKASEINSNFSKVQTYVDEQNKPSHFFYAYANDTYTISSTTTRVPFNTDVEDPENLISDGVFTAPEAGYYYLSAKIRFWNGTIPASNSLTVRMYVNGLNRSYQFFPTDSSDLFVHVEDFYSLEAGDTVEIMARCSNGTYGLFRVTPPPNWACTFKGYMLY